MFDVTDCKQEAGEAVAERNHGDGAENVRFGWTEQKEEKLTALRKRHERLYDVSSPLCHDHLTLPFITFILASFIDFSFPLFAAITKMWKSARFWSERKKFDDFYSPFLLVFITLCDIIIVVRN